MLRHNERLMILFGTAFQKKSKTVLCIACVVGLSAHIFRCSDTSGINVTMILAAIPRSKGNVRDSPEKRKTCGGAGGYSLHRGE